VFLRELFTRRFSSPATERQLVEARFPGEDFMKARWAMALSLVILPSCSLVTPKPSSPTPTVKRPAQGIYHVVRTGENLFRIGKAYDLTHEELARVNGLRDAGQIFVGQKIFIPGATRQLPVEIITPAEPSARQVSVPDVSESLQEGLVWPINGTINSYFGPRGTSFHDGIDIGASEGTPIRAIDRGEVIYSDQLKGYGNIVIIRHAQGLVSVYAHNETNLVRQGQVVAKGETVARVGSTGRVTGPHLHFEIRRNNTAQDPLKYMPQLCCLPASDTVAPNS
jgi:murein DD-endopeptidase MepM/ murein hydrolase activator NlpD